MQKRVPDFINLKNTSGSKNNFWIMYGGGKKGENGIFTFSIGVAEEDMEV